MTPSPVKPTHTDTPRPSKKRTARFGLSELYAHVKSKQQIQLRRSWFEHKSVLADNEALDDLIAMRAFNWSSRFKWVNFPERPDGAMFIKPVVREVNYVTPRAGYPMDIETWAAHINIEHERQAGARAIKTEKMILERTVLADGGAAACVDKSTPKRKTPPSRGISESPIKLDGTVPGSTGKKQRTFKTPDQPVGATMRREATPQVRKILKRCSSPLWQLYGCV